MLSILRQCTKFTLEINAGDSAEARSDSSAELLPSQPIAATLRLELLDDPERTIPALEALASDMAAPDYLNAWVKTLSALTLEVVFVDAATFSSDDCRCEQPGMFLSPSAPTVCCSSLAPPALTVAINTTHQHRIAHSRTHSRTDSQGSAAATGARQQMDLPPPLLNSSSLMDRVLEFPLSFRAPAACGPGLIAVVMLAKLPADVYSCTRHQMALGTIYREAVVREVLTTTVSSRNVAGSALLSCAVRNTGDRVAYVEDVAIDLHTTWVGGVDAMAAVALNCVGARGANAGSNVSAKAMAGLPHRCGSTPLLAAETELLAAHVAVTPYALEEATPVLLHPGEACQFAFRVALKHPSASLAATASSSTNDDNNDTTTTTTTTAAIVKGLGARQGPTEAQQQQQQRQRQEEENVQAAILRSLLHQQCVSAVVVVCRVEGHDVPFTKLTNVGWSLSPQP